MTFTKRGHNYTLDGERVPSVTTILKQGVPKPALVAWAAQSVAAAAVDGWDELSDMSLSQRLRILERAPWDQRDAAALRGTDLHVIFEAVVLGLEVTLQDRLVGPARALTRFVDRWDVQPVLTETAVASYDFRYAGTLDLIADLVDGQRWLLDLKSGKTVYDDACLQLAAYRNTNVYLDAAGDEHPMHTVDEAGVIHVTADDARLFPVDAGRRAHRTFLHAAETAKWARDCSAAWKEQRPWPVAEAITPPQRVEAS